MARTRTELEDYLVYGVDEKNRRVYFGCSLATADVEDDVTGFTFCTVEFAIRAIERMATDHPKVPIEIHMNSYGGEVYSMLALYDVIQACECQIKFYGKGAIMSCATWIMSGCDERYLYPNTTVMVHHGSPNLPDKPETDTEIDMDENVRLRAKLMDMYADNTRMPKDFWNEACKRDLYLSAEESIFLGLADEIVRPKKRGNFRKKRQHHLSQPIDQKRLSKLADKLFKRIKHPDNLVITINEYKPEPIDDKLTIEEKPSVAVQEESNKEADQI